MPVPSPHYSLKPSFSSHSEERCSALEQSSGPQLTSSPPSLVVLISTGAKNEALGRQEMTPW